MSEEDKENLKKYQKCYRNAKKSFYFFIIYSIKDE